MFNVTVLKMKDIKKYFIGMLATIVVVIVASKCLPRPTKEGKMVQKVLAENSMLECLGQTITTMSSTQEQNGEMPEKEEEIEEEPLEEVDIYIDDYVPEPPAPKLGFFGTLFAVIAGAGAASNHGHRHNGRCNGDCANCPPHYGYRYGRWYYGHDHVHGCEFGGNKGSGSMD